MLLRFIPFLYHFINRLIYICVRLPNGRQQKGIMAFVRTYNSIITTKQQTSMVCEGEEIKQAVSGVKSASLIGASIASNQLRK